MKHFLNDGFLAPNVLTAPVDLAIVDEFQPLCDRIDDDESYCTVKPKWNSDVRWISARTEDAFAHFESAFHRLGIPALVEPYLDLKREVRLYAGFLVVRSYCKEPYFHVDWRTNNEAFTLLTPLSENAEGFGLLYRKLTGDVAGYEYKRGEAIVFGDHFKHSTSPGQSTTPVSLLCFQFGSDRMDHWDRILLTAGSQSELIRQPDGRFATLPIG